MNKLIETAVLDAFRDLARAGRAEVTSTEIFETAKGSYASIRRALDTLCADGRLIRSGRARATRYRLTEAAANGTSRDTGSAEQTHSDAHPLWSHAAVELGRKLELPLAARDPVTYQRAFVDDYVPNESWLMPDARRSRQWMNSASPRSRRLASARCCSTN